MKRLGRGPRRQALLLLLLVLVLLALLALLTLLLTLLTLLTLTMFLLVRELLVRQTLQIQLMVAARRLG